MVEYLHIPCPNCRHVLRVRKQYVGIEVTCTRCDYSFVVEPPADEDAANSRQSAATESRALYEQQIAELKNDLDRVRQDFARVASENAHAAEQLQQLSERYAQRETRLSELERSLEESQEVVRQSEALIQLESIDAPRLTEFSEETSATETHLPQLARDIQELTAERDRLQEAQGNQQRELEQLRADLQQAELTLKEASVQHQAAYEVLQQELDAQRRNWLVERDSLQQQIAHEQSQPQPLEGQIGSLASDAPDNDASEELGRLRHELEQAQQRASQLEAELANLHGASANPSEPVEPTAAEKIKQLSMQLQVATEENNRLRATIGQLGISFRGSF